MLWILSILARRWWLILLLPGHACLAGGAGVTALPGGFHRVAPPAAASAPVVKPAPLPTPPAPKYQSELDSIYDPTNPLYGSLQRPAESLADLPLDRLGFVDWMAALSQGLIRPRASLSDKTASLPVSLDIIMRNTGGMDYVRFSHATHTEWLTCRNCHNEIFEAKAGSARIRMVDLFRGRYCGVCHDKVAFVTYLACERCHSVPRDRDAILPAPSGQAEPLRGRHRLSMFGSLPAGGDRLR